MTRPRVREGFAERRARRAAIDDPAVVLEAGLKYLEARGRSTAEVRRHLVAAGYRATLVDGAVTRLVSLGLLDDALFARAWVASRDRAHPRGERALRVELRQKGLDDATIADAFAARGDGELMDGVTPGRAGSEDDASSGETSGRAAEAQSPEEAAARRLIEKRRATLLREADPRTRRAKTYALLVRSGFSSELASRAAAELLSRAEREDSDEDDIDV